MEQDTAQEKKVGLLGPGFAEWRGSGATPAARSALKQRWTIAAAVAAAGMAVLIALFWDTAGSAARTWHNSTTFNHGFLIFPIAGYLIWIRRPALARIVPRANFLGLPVMAVAAFGWFVGHETDVLIVQQFAVVAMIQALVFTVVGWPATRAMAFPLFYLYLAVPFGNFLIPGLQDFTAKFVVWWLQVTGIPVFHDGVFITIPTGSFEVAEACVGARFLIATVALGFLCVNFFYLSWWRRAIFIGLSAAVPIIANGFRAYGIVMIAHLSNFQLAVDFDHLIYGWVFFAFVTFVLLSLGIAFREKLGFAGEDPGVLPEPSAESRRPLQARTPLVLAGISAALVAAAFVTYADYREASATTRTVPRLTAPAVRAPWAELAESGGDWHPVFVGSDAELMSSYAAGNRKVDLYVAYYADQRHGAELISSKNRLADRRNWSRLRGGTTEAVVEGAPLKVAYTQLVSRDGGRLVWHWYWVDGRFTSNPYFAKLLQAKVSLFGGLEGAAAVVVATDYRDAPSEAAAVLHRFLEHLIALSPELGRAALQSQVGGGAGEDRIGDGRGGER
jgi:exosortase A